MKSDGETIRPFSRRHVRRKMLLGRRRVLVTRAAGRRPYWQKNRKIFASYKEEDDL